MAGRRKSRPRRQRRSGQVSKGEEKELTYAVVQRVWNRQGARHSQDIGNLFR